MEYIFDRAIFHKILQKKTENANHICISIENSDNSLLLDTTEFIRKDLERRKGEKQKVVRLKRLEKFFKIMPLLMFITTVVLRENIAILIVIQILAILIVACAFTISIRVLDTQVRRLMPQSQATNAAGQVINGK